MVKEDLGIKIGTPKEVFWTMVKNNCEKSIENMNNDIMLNEELLIVAEKKIKDEQSNDGKTN